MKNPLKLLVSVLVAIYCMTPTMAEIVDPTRPPDFSVMNRNVIAPQNLAVSAIYIYPHKRFAIINDQLVQVGDKFGEYTITSISPYTVELTGLENRKQVLQLTTTVKQAR